ncbi:hypothetical protein HanRHA438_Chr15g0699841 [Helianthus annuus]|nr:hypothetical protein HanRHA438_Chr15g0699841 [Helianthus annuus]
MGGGGGRVVVAIGSRRPESGGCERFVYSGGGSRVVVGERKK